MDGLLIAGLAFALGTGVGLIVGTRFTAGLVGRSLKVEMDAGRLDRAMFDRLTNFRRLERQPIRPSRDTRW